MPLGGKGPAVVVVLCTEALISFLFISGRWYVRKFIKGKVGLDDYVLWATWLFQAAFALLFVVSSLHGFGQHVAVLAPEEIMEATKIELIGQSVVSIAMGLSKTGAAIFLMRLVVRPWQKWFMWFWLITINFLSILLAIVVFAQCTPTESLWGAAPTEYCTVNMTTVAFVMCSWSAAMDFALAIFPWFFLWKLNMKKKEKYTICLSLSLGVIAGVCGIVRTSGLSVLSEAEDYLYATADSVMWTSSELCITIICVSIPAFRPLWHRVFHGYVEPSSDDNSKGTGYILRSQTRKGNTTRRGSTGAAEGGAAGHFKTETVCKSGNPHGPGSRDSGSGAQFGAWYDNKSDNGSDESILAKNQGIQRVQEFTVEYEDPGRSSSHH